MSVNNKLTHAIKDRVVQNFQLNASELLISFVDGSTMKVNIVESNSPPLHEATRIRQIFRGSSKTFHPNARTAVCSTQRVDPGNSVIVRDRND